MTIANSHVEFGPDEEALVLEVLRSGHIVQGPMVERVEHAYRELAGARHAIAVSSGTTALVAALEALDLAPGAEVVTSPFTFAATLNAILETGAVATFADIGDDFTMSADALDLAITPRTAVVMPVHLYGWPADMPAIAQTARDRGLRVVEDACQAHGARVSGQAVGSFGIGCFSMYATKNVSSGEGGVVTCDDDDVADRIRLLRNQGMRTRYQYEIPGHNYRLTDLQAAVAIPQLERLAERTARRRSNAAALVAGLSELPGIVLPVHPGDREHVWHQFTIRVTADACMTRDELASRLDERGIGTGIYYPRVVFDYECYRQHPRVRVVETPNATRAAQEVLALPVHPYLDAPDLQRVVEAVRELIGC